MGITRKKRNLRKMGIGGKVSNRNRTRNNMRLLEGWNPCSVGLSICTENLDFYPTDTLGTDPGNPGNDNMFLIWAPGDTGPGGSMGALDAVQSLIANGTFIKMQDVQGNSLEYASFLDPPIWIDNIEILNPGDLFRIKVSAQTPWVEYQMPPMGDTGTLPPHSHRHTHPHRGHPTALRGGGRTNSRFSGRTQTNPKGKPKK